MLPFVYAPFITLVAQVIEPGSSQNTVAKSLHYKIMLVNIITTMIFKINHSLLKLLCNLIATY